MYGGRRLDHRQVQAVQHLVLAALAVAGPHRGGRRSRHPVGAGCRGRTRKRVRDPGGRAARGLRSRLKRTVEELLERSLGPDRAHAEVNAQLDFDQETITEETFDPEGQVVRSTQTVEEESRRRARDDDEAAGRSQPAQRCSRDPATGRTNNENTTRTEETVNYEVSRRLRNHTQVGGRVRRLSVAVLVDGRMTPNAEGELVYTPLAERARGDGQPGALGHRLRSGARRRGRDQEHAIQRRARRRRAGILVDADQVRSMRLAEIMALPVAIMLIMLVARPMDRAVCCRPRRLDYRWGRNPGGAAGRRRPTCLARLEASQPVP